MVEIKPGPELDRAVAEAIGLKSATIRKASERDTLYDHCYVSYRDWEELRGIDHQEYPQSDVPLRTFQPRVDLNAAFASAEKLGLFQQYALTCLVDNWRITPAVERPWFADPVLARAPTAALAICTAILKLNKKE